MCHWLAMFSTSGLTHFLNSTLCVVYETLFVAWKYSLDLDSTIRLARGGEDSLEGERSLSNLSVIYRKWTCRLGVTHALQNENGRVLTANRNILNRQITNCIRTVKSSKANRENEKKTKDSKWTTRKMMISDPKNCVNEYRLLGLNGTCKFPSSGL